MKKVRINKAIISKIEAEMKEAGFNYSKNYPFMLTKKALAAVGVSCDAFICPITNRKLMPRLSKRSNGWYAITW